MFILEFYLLASGVIAREDPSCRLSTLKLNWLDSLFCGDLPNSGEDPPEMPSSSFSMIVSL